MGAYVISLNTLTLSRKAAPSLPLAIMATWETMQGRPVTIDRYSGLPDEQWWLTLASAIRYECEHHIHVHEPYTVLRVWVDEHLDANEVPTGEHYVVVHARDERWPLRMRTFLVEWERCQRVNITPHSHEAWCEMWRSLYAST